MGDTKVCPTSHGRPLMTSRLSRGIACSKISLYRITLLAERRRLHSQTSALMHSPANSGSQASSPLPKHIEHAFCLLGSKDVTSDAEAQPHGGAQPNMSTADTTQADAEGQCSSPTPSVPVLKHPHLILQRPRQQMWKRICMDPRIVLKRSHRDPRNRQDAKLETSLISRRYPCDDTKHWWKAPANSLLPRQDWTTPPSIFLFAGVSVRRQWGANISTAEHESPLWNMSIHSEPRTSQKNHLIQPN